MDSTADVLGVAVDLHLIHAVPRQKFGEGKIRSQQKEQIGVVNRSTLYCRMLRSESIKPFHPRTNHLLQRLFPDCRNLSIRSGKPDWDENAGLLKPNDVMFEQSQKKEVF
ncbi:MAG: hypothetical protein WBW03_31875 [Silvibacterium sp.]